MKLTVIQEDLNRALSNAVRFVTVKAQLPILGNIYLEATDTKLIITASDIDLSLKQTIPAQIETPGKITVPAKELTEFVSYLPSGKITLSLTDTQLLEIKSSKGNATFATQTTEDFPPFPAVSGTTTLTLPVSGLEELITSVSTSSSQEDTRPVLTTIHTCISKNDLVLTATDGFRLSHNKKTLEVSSPSETDIIVLIPTKTFLEAIRLSKDTKNISLNFDSNTNQVLFTFENETILASRLIQGEYPPYERIIPKTTSTTITVDKDEFLQSVKTASIFARSSANVVKLKIGTSSIELSSNSPQVGKNTTEVEARVDGKPLEIAFNYKFLLDFINICHSKEIVILLNESLTPGVFKDSSQPNLLHIIMPVRLTD